MCISDTLVQQDPEIQCYDNKRRSMILYLFYLAVCMLSRSHIHMTAVAVCWRLCHLKNKDITYFVGSLDFLRSSGSGTGFTQPREDK
jgi:hypothetical protein